MRLLLEAVWETVGVCPYSVPDFLTSFSHLHSTVQFSWEKKKIGLATSSNVAQVIVDEEVGDWWITLAEFDLPTD